MVAHAVPRSADRRLAADMTMWIGPVDYRGGPLAVPCTWRDVLLAGAVCWAWIQDSEFQDPELNKDYLFQDRDRDWTNSVQINE